MNEARSTRLRRWSVAAAKLLIVVLVVWFLRRTIVDAWRQLDEHRWQFDFAWLAASGALYLLATLLCGVFWHRVLRAMDQPVGLMHALRAYYVGHLGKYVPGKAMVVVLRAGLVRGQGVDTSLAAVSVFYETLTMMATGALWAVVTLAVGFRDRPLLLSTATVLVLVAGAPTLPPVFRRLVRLVGVGKNSPAVAEKLAKLGGRTLLLGWGLTGLGWAILGLSFWAVLRSMGLEAGQAFEQLHRYTAAVALATVAGFVSFVPAGAVVREAVLAELIAPGLGSAAALVGVVLWRLVQVVSEIVLSGMLYLSGKALEGRRSVGR